MQISAGELQVWQAIGSVLEQEEPAEYELLPEIVEARAAAAPAIGRQPGAFDAGEIPLMAAALFSVAAPVMQAIWPKLFDAALDVGKDALKKALDRRAAKAAPWAPASAAVAAPAVPVSAQQIRAAIAQAAAARQLSPRTAESLADALVARFFGASDAQPGKTT